MVERHDGNDMLVTTWWGDMMGGRDANDMVGGHDATDIMGGHDGDDMMVTP